MWVKLIPDEIRSIVICIDGPDFGRLPCMVDIGISVCLVCFNFAALKMYVVREYRLFRK